MLCRVSPTSVGRCLVISLLTPAHSGSSLTDFLLFSSTLKMEAIRSSETSVNTSSTQRHTPEDYFFHSHRRENVKCYVNVYYIYTEYTDELLFEDFKVAGC
jgi:hypothetical protein